MRDKVYEDNTGKSRSLSHGKTISYDERIVRLKETKVRVTVKLSALRDAKTPCIPWCE